MTSVKSVVSSRPVEADSVPHVVNRELVPLARELRAAVLNLPLEVTDVQTADCYASIGKLTLVDVSGGDVEVTLPTPDKNACCGVKMDSAAGGNQIDVVSEGGELIDGAATYSMTTSRSVAWFLGTGTKWVVAVGA